MYIPREKVKAEVTRLASIDMVSRLEVESAVESHLIVLARVTAVATIIANLRDEFNRVEKYDWELRDFTISLRDDNPRAGMEHLRELAVRARLYSSRGDNDWEDRLTFMGNSGHIDDPNTIVRFVEFPIRYLTSDDWIEEAIRDAMRRELVHLKLADENDTSIEKAKERLTTTRANVAARKARIEEIEATGITVEI